MQTSCNVLSSSTAIRRSCRRMLPLDAYENACPFLGPGPPRPRGRVRFRVQPREQQWQESMLGFGMMMNPLGQCGQLSSGLAARCPLRCG